ncbi:MAG: ribosome assembly cofactor RimP [Bacteroidota bacterium]|nr:ribosome assembly cofactor RimP [Bacteroidota bacterium]MDP3432616.1 ribosome assembly cofactor RimP [Bacteroidota bacterium]
MIDKVKIAELVNEKLADDQFLVDVTISTSNVIHIMVDSDTGISINQIVEISRHVESNLDREAEDFELSVFSAGLTEPFRLVRQYKKNVDKEIEVLLTNGQKLNGLLIGVEEQAIDLEVTTNEKIEGSKKKELVTKVHHLEYSEIKEAKKIFKF